MPYSHQNYWMHVYFFYFFIFSGEHFGLWNVKIVVSAAESNFLRGLSETMSANLARIKDFSHFSHLCAKLFIITSAFYCEKMPERDPIQVLVSILWLWNDFFPEFLFSVLCSLKDVCWLCGLMTDARCSSAVFSFFYCRRKFSFRFSFSGISSKMVTSEILATDSVMVWFWPLVMLIGSLSIRGVAKLTAFSLKNFYLLGLKWS